MTGRFAATLALLAGLIAWQGEGRETQAPPTPPAALRIEPRSGSGALAIRSPLLPGDAFELVACEVFAQGEQKTDLYPIQLEPKEWTEREGQWSFAWTFAGDVRLDFAAEPAGDEVRLEYRITNGSKEKLRKVWLSPCLPTRGAPSFYPGTADEARSDEQGRRARVGRKDYSELYDRLFLWSKGRPFAFRDSDLAAEELHLAFMAKGEPPLDFSWFKNGERAFDVPLIAARSKDLEHVVALSFERVLQASSNVGDGRACFHLLPAFEDIAPGRSATVAGRVYLMAGGPEDVYERFRKDARAPSKR